MRSNTRFALLTAAVLPVFAAARLYCADKPRLKPAPFGGGEDSEEALSGCPLPELWVPLEAPFATPPSPEGCDEEAYRTLKARSGAEAASFNAGLAQARAGVCRQLYHLDADRRGPVVENYAAARRASLKAFGGQLRAQWDRFAAECSGRPGRSR